MIEDNCATFGEWSNGVIDSSLFKRKYLIIGFALAAIIGLSMFRYIVGRTPSVVEVGTFLIGFLPGLGLAIGILHFLTRRWERKEAIEDEK
jgi:hypothetical protein